ncbi:hypothetical protein AURDEDRAFT_55814, partial [Auricularia subglabra TFB-10046 SS5]
SPRAIVQLMITGSRILAKAFLEAGRQAVKNAKHRPQGGVGDAAGVTTARSGSVTDRLTREHLMTMDEAHLILNVKRGEPMEKIIRHYEHLFRANAPPVVETAKPAQGAPAPQNSKFFTGRGAGQRYHSAYIQSKVVRARERIEAEAKLASETEAPAPAEEASPPPPPPPSTPPS